MDWYVENDESNLAPLRQEMGRYLTRHAVAGSDVDGALLAASELVTNAVQNTSGPVAVAMRNGDSLGLDVQYVCLNWCSNSMLMDLGGESAEGAGEGNGRDHCDQRQDGTQPEPQLEHGGRHERNAE